MRPLARRLVIAAACAAAPFAAPAQMSDYETCLNLATVDPEQTRADAIRWFQESGAHAARHCEAAALAEMGAHRTAALILQEIAQLYDLPGEKRAELLTQAARQWLQADAPGAAMGAVDSGLGFHPTPTLYIERAALKAEARDYEGARDDLGRALTLDPENADAFALRAAAERRMGDANAALRDAERATGLNPISPLAWLEVGLAQQALGRKNDARQAWLRAIDVAPGSRAAALARGELQDMDGG